MKDFIDSYEKIKNTHRLSNVLYDLSDIVFSIIASLNNPKIELPNIKIFEELSGDEGDTDALKIKFNENLNQHRFFVHKILSSIFTMHKDDLHSLYTILVSLKSNELEKEKTGFEQLSPTYLYHFESIFKKLDVSLNMNDTKLKQDSILDVLMQMSIFTNEANFDNGKFIEMQNDHDTKDIFAKAKNVQKFLQTQFVFPDKCLLKDYIRYGKILPFQIDVLDLKFIKSTKDWYDYAEEEKLLLAQELGNLDVSISVLMYRDPNDHTKKTINYTNARKFFGTKEISNLVNKLEYMRENILNYFNNMSHITAIKVLTKNVANFDILSKSIHHNKVNGEELSIVKNLCIKKKQEKQFEELLESFLNDNVIYLGLITESSDYANYMLKHDNAEEAYNILKKISVNHDVEECLDKLRDLEPSDQNLFYEEIIERLNDLSLSQKLFLLAISNSKFYTNHEEFNKILKAEITIFSCIKNINFKRDVYLFKLLYNYLEEPEIDNDFVINLFSQNFECFYVFLERYYAELANLNVNEVRAIVKSSGKGVNIEERKDIFIKSNLLNFIVSECSEEEVQNNFILKLTSEDFISIIDKQKGEYSVVIFESIILQLLENIDECAKRELIEKLPINKLLEINNNSLLLLDETVVQAYQSHNKDELLSINTIGDSDATTATSDSFI